MSSDNAQSAVTYTFISFDSNGPSWGIPLMNAAPLGHRAAMIRMRDDIPEEDMPPRRRFVFTAPPPGCDVVESSAAAARVPRGQYDFFDTVKAGQGLIRSPGHDARTIVRVADRAEDVGYVRALHASEHRMMTFIEEVNLRINYQAQVRKQEMRGQRTAYETELQERQSVEDLAVTQMMRIHALEARAQTDTVEDALWALRISSDAFWFDERTDGIMDLMNRVCKPYLDKIVIVFFDDIQIYSKNKEEHEEHLKLILELIKKEELYAKFSKFIEGFSKIAKSMTKLTQKNVKFDWGEKEEAAFN
nr:putative reverse transcriptase domain-containing protein [Tanacetum cinerariifolium]